MNEVEQIEAEMQSIRPKGTRGRKSAKYRDLEARLDAILRETAARAQA